MSDVVDREGSGLDGQSAMQTAAALADKNGQLDIFGGQIDRFLNTPNFLDIKTAQELEAIPEPSDAELNSIVNEESIMETAEAVAESRKKEASQRAYESVKALLTDIQGQMKVVGEKEWVKSILDCSDGDVDLMGEDWDMSDLDDDNDQGMSVGSLEFDEDYVERSYEQEEGSGFRPLRF